MPWRNWLGAISSEPVVALLKLAYLRQEETMVALSSITIVAARWSRQRFPVIKTFHVTRSLSSRRL